MLQNQHEIVILKPTKVFQSFLISQLSGTNLPELRLLTIDNTGYILHKKDSNEETLDEVEKHFSTMFRYEISRWLGDRARSKIENNFLDFLCCFQFKLHNHLIIMDSFLEKSCQLLLIKPRQELLNWIKKDFEEQEYLKNVINQVNLSHLEENATVVVKNFPRLTDIKPFLQKNYHSLFFSATNRVVKNYEQWPILRSFLDFQKYFTVEIHTKLILLPNSRS